jgi:hypothetical protein
MADHVHEWEIIQHPEDKQPAVHCKDCHWWLTTEQAEALLNAAEQLSADRAADIADYASVYSRDKQALQAYAKARGE